MTISWIDEVMPCGCGIRKFAPEGGYDIEYCPKHKAAPDMYEALKGLVQLVAEDYFPDLYEDALQALNKAEGRVQ